MKTLLTQAMVQDKITIACPKGKRFRVIGAFIGISGASDFDMIYLDGFIGGDASQIVFKGASALVPASVVTVFFGVGLVGPNSFPYSQNLGTGQYTLEPYTDTVAGIPSVEFDQDATFRVTSYNTAAWASGVLTFELWDAE